MLDGYGLSCVYHAHISTGELHLRPVLNLKEEKDRKLFRTVATKTAELVKKHRGSLSGEHGDGRLRGEFIPLLLGDKVYSLLKEVKEIWDSPHIFNMGKIVDTPPMDANLRYEQWDLGIDTYFDYSRQKGWLCAIEQCNGSGIVVNQAYWAVRCVLLIALQEMKEILRVLVPIHYVNF